VIAEVDRLALVVGRRRACAAFGLPRATYYRARSGEPSEPPSAPDPGAEPSVDPPATRPHRRALSAEQKQRILDVCATERFINCSPGHIVAALLDDGEYICSERTLYRVLGADAPVRDRRRQRRHPNRPAPVLMADAPNRVWSWDITRLKGPYPGASYHLYVIIDIYSRYVVGWCVHEREDSAIARALIAECCHRQGIQANQLVVHADRGPSMRSKHVSELLADLHVGRSHSRPYCSNDNPYSESQFKTLKYSPAFPNRFGSLEDARRFCREFFEWYNMVHRHSGIAMLTPSQMHHGEAERVLEHRDAVLAAAYTAHPERFVNGLPTAQRPPGAVWINKPVDQNHDRTAEPSPVVNPTRLVRSHGGGFSTGDGARAGTAEDNPSTLLTVIA